MFTACYIYWIHLLYPPWLRSVQFSFSATFLREALSEWSCFNSARVEPGSLGQRRGKTRLKRAIHTVTFHKYPLIGFTFFHKHKICVPPPPPSQKTGAARDETCHKLQMNRGRSEFQLVLFVV
jgi:hypothetical protein